MVNKSNTLGRSRRTFVAVSFGPKQADASKVDTLYYVSYKDDEIDHEGSIKFAPIHSSARCKLSAEPFELALGKIGFLFNVRSYNPPGVPVVVWNDRSRKIFDTLIHESEINYMYYPPRYFILQKYASRKLWDSSDEHSVQEIAKKLSISISPCKEPDAEHIAVIMRRLEDVVEFPPIVAKAFCAICASVIADNKIEEKEAIELSSFLQLISDRYPEFKQLEEGLRIAVENGLLSDVAATPESDRLIGIIEEMINYFRKFIPDKENSEN